MISLKLCGRSLVAALLLVGSSLSQASILDHARSKAKELAIAKLQGYVAPAQAPVALPPVKGDAFEGCQQHFPSSQPDRLRSDARLGLVALCFDTFASLYSTVTKTPMVVVERLNRERLLDARDEQRTDEFFEDDRIKRSSRAQLQDYVGTGMDRGHMAPAANQPNPAAMAQSFALTNIVPQDPHNNRKVWSKIESDVRKFVRRANGNVYVFTGPLFKAERTAKIGRSQVWVPTHLFKLVYDESNRRAWAYVLPNTPDAQVGPPMGYDEFKQVSGYDFLDPRGLNR
jgi:endonuclease G, mitochondrial